MSALDRGLDVDAGGVGNTLTIMFEDLEGSTAMAALRGDLAWSQARRAHEALVRREIQQHGGREVQFLGDGFVVAFSSARQGLLCAVDIQRAIQTHNVAHPSIELKARIGLNSGEVLEEGGAVVGASVNGAARIGAKARGGQILASQVVKELAGTTPSLALADRGLHWLKGFPERWRLFEVIWREQDIPAGPPTVVPSRTPFIGREDEYADLRRLLGAAELGEGGLVLIGGEPGVGKTRIMEELMTEAEGRGMTALMGRCYETEAPPYIAFVEILETAFRSLSDDRFAVILGDSAAEVARLLPDLYRRLPEIPAPLSMPPEQARRFLFNNLTDVLQRLAVDQPLLLLLDDLHWAEQSTLLLLEHIARRLRTMPILVVGAYRDIEVDPEDALARTLQHFYRDYLVPRYVLRRLPPGGVEEMLRSLAGSDPPAGIVQAIHRETEGNPLFVEEVFRHLAEEGHLFDERGGWRTDIGLDEVEVPETIRFVLGRRLARLSEECRRVLTAASVIGRGVSIRVLEGLVEEPPEKLHSALEEAERARLVTLVGSEPEVRFVHELIRQTLLSGISILRRPSLHARVAEVMERVYADSLFDHISELAYHLVQAGASVDQQRTIRYLILAGEGALQAAGYEEALRHLDTALVLGPADGRTRADVLFGLGSALRSLNRLDEGLARWRQAIELYEALGEAEAAGHVCAEAVRQLNWAGRWGEAVEMAARGLGTLGEHRSEDRARLLSNTAIIFSASGNHDVAAAMLAEALDLANDFGNEGLLAYALGAQTIQHFFYMRPRQGAAVGMESAELFRRTGDLWGLAEQLSFVQLALLWQGDIGQAEKIGAEAEALASRLGHVGALLVSRAAQPLALSGDWALLESFANDYLELCISTGHPWVSTAYALLGLVALWRGKREEAMGLFGESISREVAPAVVGAHRGLLLLAHATNGDMGTVAKLFNEFRSELPTSAGHSTVGSWMLLLASVEALAIVGEKQEAAALYQFVVDALARGQAFRIFDLRLVETIAGIAAAAGHKWEQADRHFGRALRMAEELPHRVEQAEARRFYAQMLLDRDGPGDRARADELLGEATGLYRRLGMQVQGVG